MSYDIVFVRREPGQSWDDAFEALETITAESNEATAMDPAVWRQIVEGIRRINPTVTEDGNELIDDETSIQIQCWDSSASITVPYWHTGDAAKAVVQKMYVYAAVITACSGLEAYDNQLGLGMADAIEHLDEAAALFDNTAAFLARQRKSARD